MVKKLRRGLCIGGPLAGKDLMHNNEVYQLTEYDTAISTSPQSLDMDPASTCDVKVHVYRHEPRFLIVGGVEEVQAWLHDTVGSAEDAIRTVLRYYKRRRDRG